MTTTPAAPAAELNATKLRELHKAATPGPWDADTLNSEGSYGSGGDTHEGFATTAIYDADGKVLLDALNSDAILVQEEWDEDGGRAYDLTSAANASLITYLRNAVPDILALIEERDRLREEVETLASDMSRARDAANEHLNEVERLRGALEKIAKQDYGYQAVIESGAPPEEHADYFCSMVNWRRQVARAALAGEKP